MALLGEVFITNLGWRFAFHIYTVILGCLGLMTGILWKYIRSAGN